MSDVDFDELRSWLHECGLVARTLFNQVTGRRKADRSWVTEADVTIEQILAERIAARYPEHGIIGEEQTRSETNREFLWAIDPVDGTAAFVSGLPIWGTSLGLLRRGRPCLGMIYFPLLEECYWAGPDGGAFMNGRPIHVATPHDWESEDWLSTPSNAHRRFTIDFIGKTRSLGATVASFCYVARGSAIGALITRAAIWDIAAGLAILRAAGGVAVGLSGAAVETESMLDGQPLLEPAILGESSQVAKLRSVVALRRAT